MDNSSLILLQSKNYQSLLHLPLKSATRIKYTCFNVSKNYIVFGATSGALYMFDRRSFAFMNLIPNKDGTVTNIAVTSNENFIALSTHKSIVCVIELKENAVGKLVTRAEDFSEFTIAALEWDPDNTTLYIGTSIGKVFMLTVSFLNTSIFDVPVNLLVNTNSEIVQLCPYVNFILVSDYTKCCLCDNVKRQFKQVGKQARNGRFGACFLRTKDNLVRIFSARPGYRLWEVDFDGQVHSTHLFKSYMNEAPAHLVTLDDTPKIVNESTKKPINFSKLFQLQNKFIFTFSKEGVCLLDVDKVVTVFASNYINEIADARIVEDSMYIWTSSGAFHELSLLPVYKCVLKLYFEEYYTLCEELISVFFDALINSDKRILMELQPTKDIAKHFQEPSDVLIQFLQKLESVNETSNSIRLCNGMRLVNNKYVSDKLAMSQREIDQDTTTNDHFLDPCQEMTEFDKLNSVRLPSHLVNSKQEDIPMDKLFEEMSLYHSPFITVASYDIMQDSLAEIGTSLSEIFSMGTSNIKNQLQNLEKRINPFRSKYNIVRSFQPSQVYEHFENAGMEYDGEDVVVNANYAEDTDDPIVHAKRKIAPPVPDIDVSKVLDACRGCLVEGEEPVENLLEAIFTEYTAYMSHSGTKNGSGSSKKYFPFNAYFDKDVIRKIGQVYVASLKSGILLRYLRCNNIIEIDSDIIGFYPDLLTTIYTYEDLEQDFIVSKSLLIFSEVLDPYTIINDIEEAPLPCYYLTLTCVINYFQDGDVQKNCSAANGEWPVPIYLNTMLLMMSLDQIEAFCQMGIKKRIGLTQVSYLILTLDNNKLGSQEEEENAGKQKRNVFLTYLTKYLRNFDPDRPMEDRYGETVFNYEILCHVFCDYANAMEIPPFSICENCYFPVSPIPLSETRFVEVGKVIVTHIFELVQDVGRRITEKDQMATRCSLEWLKVYSYLMSNDKFDHRRMNFCFMNSLFCNHWTCNFGLSYFKEQLMSDEETELLITAFSLLYAICRKNPYLWYHVGILQATPDVPRYKMLTTQHFIQLGLIDEVTEVLKESSYSTVKGIFSQNLDLQKGSCLNCPGKTEPSVNAGLDWTELGIFALSHLGVSVTMDLLSQIPIPHTLLEKRFFQCCITSEIPLVHNYPKKQVVNHLIALTADMNNSPSASAELEEELINCLRADTKRTDLVARKVTSNAHHWGVAFPVSYNTCPCCMLPVWNEPLMKEDEAGLTVFSCGHQFHTICLRSKQKPTTCFVCNKTGGHADTRLFNNSTR